MTTLRLWFWLVLKQSICTRLTKSGVPVDLMVPKNQVKRNGRSADIAPHSPRSARSTAGIEACLIDNSKMTLRALDPKDSRFFEIQVVGPAALLIAKSYKIGERVEAKRRIENKDAHDIYKILTALDTKTLSESLRQLLEDPFAGESVRQGINYFRKLFASGPDSPGSQMAGEAERDFGNFEIVTRATSLLAEDLFLTLA